MIARTSSFYFKGKQVTIAEIANTLHVAHLLEGSVRKAGRTMRVTAQLIRAKDGVHHVVGDVRPRLQGRVQGPGRDRRGGRKGAPGQLLSTPVKAESEPH